MILHFESFSLLLCFLMRNKLRLISGYRLLHYVVSGAIGYSSTMTSSQLAVVPRDEEDNLDAVQLELDGVVADTMLASLRYRSRGVTAGTSSVTVHVPIDESMLTLLLQLFRRFSQASVYRLSLLSASQNAIAQSRVGDAEFFIRKLLDSVCAQSTECADVINSQCQSIPSVNDTAQPKDTHHENGDERHVLIL